MSEWIRYKPGDPIPEGRVFIDHGPKYNNWRSPVAAPASEWRGWKTGAIYAYRYEDDEDA